MRRTSRGGRGVPAWQMQRQQPRMSGGSFMNDHIGLQDIDKELELLKRKREIIEQQQQILTNEFQRNDYQQPYANNSQSHNRFDDYAQLYDEYGQSSRKRPIAVWEDDIPTKRFSGPTNRSNDSLHLQRSGPSRFLGGNASFRPARSGPVRRDFNPSRVTKRPAPSANKVNSHPAPERKKPATAAREAVGCEWNRLRPDHEPSAQLNGRLELALGHIIKEIRAEHKRDELNSPSVIKIIKKIVRERIRTLMMGQLIDRVDVITAKYRENYNKESDADLVKNAIDEHTVTKDTSQLKIEDPETYFKKNLYKITEYKLKRMFNKIEELHHAESKEVSPDASEEAKALAKNPLHSTITSQEKYQNLDRFLTAKLSTMLKKHIPYIMKIIDLDQKYLKLKNNIVNETMKRLNKADDSVVENNAEVSVVSEDQANTSGQAPRHVYRPLPYYVKILGKPGLPKRKLMETFFDKYKPVSVKKHRTMHSLLFAGFEDKESYDKILAADGHTIGKYKLSIRVSERVIPEPKKDDLNASSDKIISAELDAQITDLLSSIRKGEEVETGSITTPGTGEIQSVNNAEKNNDVAEENNSVNEENNDIAEENNTDVGENNDAVVEKSAVAENNTDAGENVTGDTTMETIENTDAITEVVNAETAGTENTDVIDNIDEFIAEQRGNDDALDTENATEDADTVVTEEPDTTEVAAVDSNAGTDDADAGTDDANALTDGDNNDYPNDGIPWTNDDTEKPANGKEEDKKTDQVQALASEAKTTGRATPTRASSRLAATPSRIQTRRASRLAQNDNN